MIPCPAAFALTLIPGAPLVHHQAENTPGGTCPAPIEGAGHVGGRAPRRPDRQGTSPETGEMA